MPPNQLVSADVDRSDMTSAKKQLDQETLLPLVLKEEAYG